MNTPVKRHSSRAIALVGTLLATAGLSLALPATAADTPAEEDIVIVTVNGTPYQKKLFERFYGTQLQQAGVQDSPELRAQAFRSFLGLVIASQDGDKRKVQDMPAVKGTLELQRILVTAEAALQVIASEAEVTEDELKKAYERFAEQAKRTEYRARHILVADKEKAEALIKKLEKSKGKDFEKVAKENSTANADKGGDLGWFQPSPAVQPIADALAKLEPGQFTTEPVQTQYGWHIVKLEETRPAAVPEFDAIKTELETLVRREKAVEIWNKLQNDAKIELNEAVVRVEPAKTEDAAQPAADEKK